MNLGTIRDLLVQEAVQHLLDVLEGISAQVVGLSGLPAPAVLQLLRLCCPLLGGRLRQSQKSFPFREAAGSLQVEQLHLLLPPQLEVDPLVSPSIPPPLVAGGPLWRGSGTNTVLLFTCSLQHSLRLKDGRRSGRPSQKTR